MGEDKKSSATIFSYSCALKTGYQINLTESSFLNITPVVENPDPDADPAEAFLDRTTLEQQLFGRYYFFPDWGFLRIGANTRRPAG